MTATEPATEPASGMTPGTTSSGARRARPRLLAAGAGLAVLLVSVGAGLWLRAGDAEAPYDDPAVTGRLALCDADGDPVSSGSTSTALPATVVGATAATTGTDGTVTLFGYQPREGVEAAEWSGIPLTAASAVTAGTPAVLETGPGALTVAQFIAGYPAAWDGWVQLRLLRGSADGTDTTAYDALDLHISGDHWQASAAGTCATRKDTP